MSRFDDEAKSWDDNPNHQKISSNVSKAILDSVNLTKDMKAFEYGCGTGLLSFSLHKRLGSITMADNSEGMLDVLKDKIKKADIENMHPVKLDLTNTSDAHDKYDLIYTQMTMHHIPDTDQILQTFHKMLQPGGHVCIADLDKEDGSFHGKDVKDVHRGFDRKELEKKAQNAGFKNITFKTALHLTKEVEGKDHEFPIFLMVAES